MNIIFDWDPRYRQGIIKCDSLDLIREKFSVENKSAFFTRRYNPYISRRKYIITPSGRFDIGLFNDILEYVKTFNAGNIVITKPFFDIYKSPLSDKNITKLKIDLRDYQKEAIEACLKQGNGVVVLPTAAGKTLAMAALIQTIRDQNKSNLCLIIVPTLQLINQTYSDFISYGINPQHITMWSGEHQPSINAKIIIAGLPILQSEKQDLSIFNNIDLLIIDECHKLRKDNKFNNLLKNTSTIHRFGFTGTLPSDLIDRWNIVGKMGPIVYEKPSYELRDQNYTSKVLIKVVNINYKDKPKYTQNTSLITPTTLYNEEMEFLYKHTFRNQLIATLVNKLDKNCLIMVDRISHGRELFEILSDKTEKKCYFIQGIVEVEERELIRKAMEQTNNIVCIAMSQIFSTGINIKNLHYILFASPGKAKIKIIQSIGRGVRLHQDKDKLIVYDFADKLLYGSAHLKQRMRLYDDEKITTEIKEISEI